MNAARREPKFQLLPHKMKQTLLHPCHGKAREVIGAFLQPETEPPGVLPRSSQCDGVFPPDLTEDSLNFSNFMNEGLTTKQHQVSTPRLLNIQCATPLQQ